MTVREQAAATVVDLFHDDERVALVLATSASTRSARSVTTRGARSTSGSWSRPRVAVAARFALEGYHPVVHTIAPFLAERPPEQVKLDFGYQRLGGLFIWSALRTTTASPA